MLFVNEKYDKYNYLVEVSDNYVVLSNQSYANGSYSEPDNISVVYQYFKPSSCCFETTMTIYNQRDFDKIQKSSDFWDRGDCISVFSVSVLIVFLTLFIINILTRLVKRGGFVV